LAIRIRNRLPDYHPPVIFDSDVCASDRLIIGSILYYSFQLTILAPRGGCAEENEQRTEQMYIDRVA